LQKDREAFLTLLTFEKNGKSEERIPGKELTARPRLNVGVL
jgi:hypothetical protein